MYDWANSAYSTAIVSGLLPIYFKEGVMPSEGVALFGQTFVSATLWPAFGAVAALLVLIAAPALGAAADLASVKKRLLLSFCYMGVLNAALLSVCARGDVWQTALLYIVSQFCFVAANVFYDAFLPQIAPEGRQDWVSSKGFAYGYIGGGIQFALCLALIVGRDMFGLSEGGAVRVCMLMTAVWWGGFALVTAFLLKETPSYEALPDRFRGAPKPLAYLGYGFSRSWTTARKIARMPSVLRFLIAYMIYSGGIQVVIHMATLFGTEELKMEPTGLMITLLIIQFIAFGGALLFGWMAGRLGAKRAVIVSLLGWTAAVVCAYFIQTQTQFFALAVLVGLVLGGAQALSRSLYGQMIPEQSAAEFYGFYSVFNKAPGFWGLGAFAALNHLFGFRPAMLCVGLFFAAGMVLLAGVNEKTGEAAASADRPTP